MKLFEEYIELESKIPSYLEDLIDIDKILPKNDGSNEYFYNGSLIFPRQLKTKIKDYSIFNDLNITWIHGDLNICGNPLGTLEGCPGVGGVLLCMDIGLKDLKGCPFTSSLVFDNNEVENLNGCHPDITYVSCVNNKLVSLEGCPKVLRILQCSDNKLTSLALGPEKYEGQLTELEHAGNLLLSIEYTGNPRLIAYEHKDSTEPICYTELNKDILDSISKMTHSQITGQLEFLKVRDSKGYDLMVEALSELGYEILDSADDDSELF